MSGFSNNSAQRVRLKNCADMTGRYNTGNSQPKKEGQAFQLTEQSGHLAWCALVALALARQDHKVHSQTQENMFLTRWLATALKQQRFPREVAPDIQWLLRQGRKQGISAKLACKLNYFWRSCTGELSQQNDLFRLTFALETAKDMHWNYQLLSDREWTGRDVIGADANTNNIFLSRTNLSAAFDSNGCQVAKLTARLTGKISDAIALFNRCGWQAEPDAGVTMLHHYTLTALTSPRSM